MIGALEKPVYRGCFTLIYAYGLRIGEAITLPVTAVDSQQMVLRVIGKRNKERVLPLTESILDMLREVWKTHRGGFARVRPCVRCSSRTISVGLRNDLNAE